MRFKANIKRALYKNGYSINKASQITGLKYQFVQRICKTDKCTLTTLLRLANALGIPPAEFFEEVEERE